MRDKAITIGITPAQAEEQRWLNTFATAVLHTSIQRINHNLKTAGRDKTGKRLREARRECNNLIKYLDNGNLEVTVTVREKPDSLNQ